MIQSPNFQINSLPHSIERVYGCRGGVGDGGGEVLQNRPIPAFDRQIMSETDGGMESWFGFSDRHFRNRKTRSSLPLKFIVLCDTDTDTDAVGEIRDA